MKYLIAIMSGLIVAGVMYAGFVYLPDIINKPESQLSTINEPIVQLIKEDVQIPEDIPEDNQVQQENMSQELDDQIPPPLPACNPKWKCGTWSICTSSLQIRTCVDSNSCGVLINKPPQSQSCINTIIDVCNNIEGVQATVPTGMSMTNGNCSTVSIAPQVTTPIAENYYNQSVYRVRTLISINQSYKAWLQDTNEQFRSAILILSGHSGTLRDASLDLANSIVTAISDLTTNANQHIIYWEGALNVLNSHPNDSVPQSTYNLLKTPESAQAEIDTVKKDINADLNSVLDSLQYF